MTVSDDQIEAFLASAGWRFASSMADNPHWYVLERDYGGPVFDALVERIEQGEVGCFRGRAYRYATLGDFVYWVMPSLGGTAGRVVNRKRVEQAEWDQGP
jgi:hypothetical protein